MLEPQGDGLHGSVGVDGLCGTKHIYFLSIKLTIENII